ncbi:YusW family protein [Sporosarcina sp. GW1-11]|uniref:YusW family protein n=1 Tax=Sporosarcina sp. GW1-11 TaxID=2899126 RepID=UPI00294F355D|nr:YusW family protein [Sporosarcina sp. GW1-11]MDV6378308.1 YusW family protein [Sporosarcina sp. GW1-11]
MKRLLMTTVSVMAIVLAGCGSNTKEPVDVPTPSAQVEQPADTNTTVESTTSQQTDATTEKMKADMGKLSFKEIDVDVSYSRDKEYEAEIEQDNNEPFKAKVEDELNGVHLKGQEAFDILYPKIQQLQLTKDSTKEETIDQVLTAFGLDSNYEKFEVEIHFNDGSKLDVEDRK